MAIGQCKFCGKDRQFARAHIIPRSFYKINQADGPNYIYSSKSDRGPKRSPSGIYDEGLICLECESKLAYLDTYAANKLKPWPRRSQLFKDETGFILKIPGQSAGGYWLKDINIERLKLFFCFLVWRCARTTREEFSIELPGKLTLRLETALKSRDVQEAEIYVFGARYSDRKWTATYSPWPRTFKDDKPINFVMYGLRFLVHFQKPIELPELSLGHTAAWPIIFDEFKGSKLHKITMQMATKHPNPWASLQSRAPAN
jgi:hypothetical protein